MASLRTLLGVFAALLLVLAVVILGLIKAEGLSFLDALWLSVISLSTIGYGDFYPKSIEGRLFIMFLIVSGVGLFGYLFSAVLSKIVEGHLNDVWRKRKMMKRISQLKEHIVVCGAGRVGLEVIKELLDEKQSFVLIEKDPAKLETVKKYCRTGDILSINENATEEQTLLAAGIERAAGLITTFRDDAVNLMIIVTCKDFNPAIKIISRATHVESVSRLKRAGADTVICPSVMAGNWMAMTMVKPASISFMQSLVDDAGLDIEELVVVESSPLVGKELRESKLREDYDAMLLAIKRGENYIVNPKPDERFLAEDTLILSALHSKLPSLEMVVCGKTGAASHVGKTKGVG